MEINSRMLFSPRKRVSFLNEDCCCNENWFVARLVHDLHSAILAPLPRCSANLKLSQQSESVHFGTLGIGLLETSRVEEQPKCGQSLMVRPSFPRCVKPDSHAVTGIAKFSSGFCSRGGCARCRLAAQAAPVNESIGRDARDSSNRDLSR